MIFDGTKAQGVEMRQLVAEVLIKGLRLQAALNSYNLLPRLVKKKKVTAFTHI